MKWYESVTGRAVVSVVFGLAAGALVALASPGAFLTGWLAAGLLLTVSAFTLVSAWRWAGGEGMLAWLVALAFLLRLGLGIGLNLALPDWGYDQEVQNAGYLFPDAYHRDREAYALALSGERLLFNPQLSLSSDQYGGLGLSSALIYRYLSPDAHRPALILILGSLFFALGVPFLWKAAHQRLGQRAARLAVWIFTLYPDGLFFSASQMREPFMLGLSAVALWGVLAWRKATRGALVAVALSLAGMFFFSTRSALFVAGVLALLFWLEFSAGHAGKTWKWLGWAGLAVGTLAAALLTWQWFAEAAAWDQLVTVRGSGRLEAVLKDLGPRFEVPVVMIYGLAQPVLPAAIAEPAIPLWKTIVLFRSLGWYLIAPLLIYAGFSAWKCTHPSQKRLVLWAVIAAGLWFCVASLRAGGDMTDNPRYRVLFLALMTLTAAWAVDWALARRDAWLGRWLLVEGIFLGFFTQWYFSRYFHLGGRLPFLVMVAVILGLSALVLVGGWVWDRRRKSTRG